MKADSHASRERRALKRALLSVTVHHGVDFRPDDEGIILAGRPERLVSWAHCRSALNGLAADHPIAPDLLARFLTMVLTVAAVPDLLLGDSARVVGLPVDHPVNPGLSWVVERLHGEALDLGLGIRGLDPRAADRVVVVHPSVWGVLDADPLRWWRGAVSRLEDMGAVAVERLVREPNALRPVGDADAVTLLGSRRLREALAARDNGMAAIAVPMRRRGWTRLSLLDPAFAPAAAAATDPVERGFPRPLLVTAEEVVMAADGSWARLAVIDGRLHGADVAPIQRA